MSEQTQESRKAPAKEHRPGGGSNLTPKSIWRNKRGEFCHATWLKQFETYIKKVNPKPKQDSKKR